MNLVSIKDPPSLFSLFSLCNVLYFSLSLHSASENTTVYNYSPSPQYLYSSLSNFMSVTVIIIVIVHTPWNEPYITITVTI